MGKQLVKIVKEICEKEKLKFQSFSDEYLLLIENDQKKMFILGNKFPNNNAAIEQICNDKSALSDLLEYYHIPHVPHHYLLSPNISKEEDYLTLPYQLFDKYQYLVCKANRGTGGKNVLKVEKKEQIKEVIDNLFNVTSSIAICPFIKIINEYRVLVLNGKVYYAFKKIKPYIIGDGKKTVKELLKDYNNYDKLMEIDNLDLDYLPKENERFELSWKHNLGGGANPKLVTDNQLLLILEKLAIDCVNKLDISFASIDIIEKENNLFEVLEINSGVMIENFSSYCDQYYNLSKNAIREAIISFLGVNNEKIH